MNYLLKTNAVVNLINRLQTKELTELQSEKCDAFKHLALYWIPPRTFVDEEWLEGLFGLCELKGISHYAKSYYYKYA